MAAETLILRPTHSNEAGQTNIGSSLPGTEAFNAWTLVSEEDADDDATWVEFGPIKPGYSFTVPDEYHSKIPINIRIYARAAVGGISLKPYIVFQLSDFYDGSNYEKLYVSTEKQYLSTSYQTFYEDITNSDIISAWYNVLLNQDPTARYGHLMVTFQNDASSSSSKGDDGYNKLTQLYLELTYDDEPPSSVETINLKQNGVWIPISGDIYKKQNGVWLLSDSSMLEDGFKYVLNDITVS